MIGRSDFGAARILGGRALQEDEYALLLNDQPRDSDFVLLAVVADGMGGAPGGRQAGKIAVTTFVEVFEAFSGTIAERLEKALRHANRELAMTVDESPDLKGMGTTLLAACFTREGLYWINVGDSVLWVFRNNQLLRLNEDHSYRTVLYEKVKTGEMTIDEARNSPHKNTLTSALTGASIPFVEIHATPMPFKSGDCFVVASNGLLSLSQAALQASLAQLQDQKPKQIAALLLKAVEQKAAPNQDNATALVVKIRNT